MSFSWAGQMPQKGDPSLCGLSLHSIMRTKEGKGDVSYHLIHLPSQLNSSLCLRGGMVLMYRGAGLGEVSGAV